MRDDDGILVDVDDVDFKLAFKAALIFKLGQRQPLLSAMVKETDLKRSISAASRQLDFDEDELRKAKKEAKELRKSLEKERRRADDFEDELKDSGRKYAELRDSKEMYCEEREDLRERLDIEIKQCRENMQALRETEAKKRAAEQELAELRAEHSAVLKKLDKIMTVLIGDGDGDRPSEVKATKLQERFQQNDDATLNVRAELDNDGSSPASAIMVFGDESESCLAGSFAKISLKSRTAPLPSEDGDSEEEDTPPVFLREMAHRHKERSENFLERARSAEKWGDPVAAERRRTEAEQYAKLAQHYHKLAATKVFHRNNPHLHNGDFVTKGGAKRSYHIDVHHLLRHEALEYVQSHIDLCKSVGLDNTIVICGQGNHSAKGSPVLRNAILDDLEKLSHTGLKATVLESNPGRVSVTWTFDA
ncbi:hypothetical protein SCHPADRAFT_1002228 [Schizopora paradoxa]|uniref:Smr domain-containing protein n=1 Tax=Schizopora paradoxa TaxID=27342 RepID=A0A0H2R4E4_9AGAM|nr:hypothetical protein SCHPADRAFT_1002228 [Schizopora paradoxa]